MLAKVHHRLDFISGVIDFVNQTKKEEQVLHYGFSVCEGAAALIDRNSAICSTVLVLSAQHQEKQYVGRRTNLRRVFWTTLRMLMDPFRPLQLPGSTCEASIQFLESTLLLDSFMFFCLL